MDAARIASRTSLVVLAVLAPLHARANDTATGGSGSDLVPLTTSEVRMKSEDILIRHVPNAVKNSVVPDAWDVEAHYVFENLTDHAVQLQVGFPEYACEGGDPEVNPDAGMCDPKPLRFESMRTTVDGKAVAHRRGKIRDGHPWRPR